jgi:NADH-quinone oxidoreductase subunit E/NADP-reducing hydrogenase subunit HndA
MEGNILIVDDEEVVIKSCERILAPQGYNVKGVTRARDAMESLENGGFDLVITDLKMPEVDGLELIHWIHKNNPQVGIVVITGYPSQESIKDALEHGIIDYLPKPFSPELLLHVTEKAISTVKAKVVAEEKPMEVTDVEAKFNEIMDVINKNKHKPGSLIPILQQTQEILGYLPPTVQRLIAKELNIPVSEIHGVVSFYSFFTMKPKGKHNIRVCLGTACYVKRASEILAKLKELLGIEEGEITEDRKFSMETVRCLGACGLAPVVVIDHDTHGAVDPVKVGDILSQYD